MDVAGGDGTPLPGPIYQGILRGALWTSGLYHALVGEPTTTDLMAWGNSRRVLAAVLGVLLQEQWVVVTDDRWRWQGPELTAADALWNDLHCWTELGQRLGTSIPHWQAEWQRLGSSAEELGRWIVQTCAPAPLSRWLDVGGGGGGVAAELARVGVHSILADIPEVIELVRQLRTTEDSVDVEYWAGDIFKDLPAGTYDGVVCARFVDNLETHRCQQLLERLRQRLNPGGKLVVGGYFQGVSPCAAWFNLRTVLGSEGHCYAVETLAQCARAANLQIVRQVDQDGHGGYSLIELIINDGLVR